MKKKDKKVPCQMCERNIKTKQYYKVCSKICLIKKLDYDSIIMPKRFILHVNNHTINNTELIKILSDFALRHKYNKELVEKKNKELFLKYKKEVAND